MKIGLIDVDSHNYPNLPLMKLSAYHKSIGDGVEWYQPMLSGHCDMVYMSKVFTFTPDYEWIVDADEIVKGGTGFFYPDGGVALPDEVEHIYPDYSLYGIKDKAYGFLTRGCPRGCDFCIVKDKEGRKSVKVSDLDEFWRGQKEICLHDPNILACKDWKELFEQLIDSGSWVDFNQGLDVRMMTEEKAYYLSRVKTRRLHFAYDRIEDQEKIEPMFKSFRKMTKIRQRDLMVYVLVGDRERRVTEADLHRIYWLRENGYAPYVMIYDKQDLPRGHELKRLQRWVNNPFIFWKCERFEDYKREG